jgi:hypothetical protein
MVRSPERFLKKAWEKQAGEMLNRKRVASGNVRPPTKKGKNIQLNLENSTESGRNWHMQIHDRTPDIMGTLKKGSVCTRSRLASFANVTNPGN